MAPCLPALPLSSASFARNISVAGFFQSLMPESFRIASNREVEEAIRGVTDTSNGEFVEQFVCLDKIKNWYISSGSFSLRT